jgi:hypothetical protein
MSDAKQKRRDASLAKWLKRLLGENAALECQDQDELLAGDPGRTNAEVVARIIVKKATVEQDWKAIELLADRTEGKPVQGQRLEDGSDRSVEERIEDVTRAHLNDLAAAVGADAVALPQAGELDRRAPDAADRPARPARNPLDLPEDGLGDSEDA